MPPTRSHLIVPLDGSRFAERALPVAQALSAEHAASITLVAVVAAEDQVTAAADMLRRAADAIHLAVTVDVLVGLPAASALVSYAVPEEGHIVVMTTHARTAIGELLLGSVADEVVRRSRVPVVLVGPHVTPPADGEPYRDVVMCLDGSPEGERLAAMATPLHNNLGLHPWLFQVRRGGDGGSRVDGDALESNELHRTADALAHTGLEVDWDIGHGSNRAEAITDFAALRRRPIIAVATGSHHAVARLTASSLTVTLARSAPCPVFVVGPACAIFSASASASSSA